MFVLYLGNFGECKKFEDENNGSFIGLFYIVFSV